MKSKIASGFSKIGGFFKSIWARKGQKKVWIPAVVIIIALLMSLGGGNKDTGTYIYIVQPREFVQEVELQLEFLKLQQIGVLHIPNDLCFALVRLPERRAGRPSR